MFFKGVYHKQFNIEIFILKIVYLTFQKINGYIFQCDELNLEFLNTCL
jgi:hypothetical protein